MLGYTTVVEIIYGDPGGFLHSIREQCMRIHEFFIAFTSSTPSSPPWQFNGVILKVTTRIAFGIFIPFRHLTRFRYSTAVSESIMETRMHPRSDSTSICLTFSLSVSPRCRVFTLPRPSRQQCSSLRYPRRSQPACDYCRVGCGATDVAGCSPVPLTRCLAALSTS